MLELAVLFNTTGSRLSLEGAYFISRMRQEGLRVGDIWLLFHRANCTVSQTTIRNAYIGETFPEAKNFLPNGAEGTGGSRRAINVDTDNLAREILREIPKLQKAARGYSLRPAKVYIDR